ncbi:MAG: hypothetical protein IJ760_05355 [Bacteroidales bacterium]|nr:hypothetical protein [Bacteroidales bacterium]
MIEEDKFEQLWQMAEAGRYGEKMAREYPSWLQRRRVTARASLGVAALLLVAGVALPMMHSKSAQDFDKVYCNRDGQSDAYWAQVAGEMLTIQAI